MAPFKNLLAGAAHLGCFQTGMCRPAPTSTPLKNFAFNSDSEILDLLLIKKRKEMGKRSKHRRGRKWRGPCSAILAAVAAFDQIDEWCLLVCIEFTVTNRDKHWKFYFEDRVAEWWPGTHRLVFDRKYKDFLKISNGWAGVAKELDSRWPLKPRIDAEFQELVASF